MNPAGLRLGHWLYSWCFNSEIYNFGHGDYNRLHERRVGGFYERALLDPGWIRNAEKKFDPFFFVLFKNHGADCGLLWFRWDSGANSSQ